MNLREAKDLVRRFAVNAGAGTFEEADIVAAIKWACNEFIRRTRLTQATGTLTLTANTASFSPSSLSDFSPARLLSAEIQYVNAGTWAASTAYTLNQYVQGDGSPDSLLYLCKESHTSSGSDEPGTAGGSQYWTQIAWPGGVPVKSVTYETIRQKLNKSIATGVPKYVSFRGLTEGFVQPAPDVPYELRLTYYQPLVDLAGDGTEINIPEEYIHGVIVYGATAFLQHTDPQMRYASQSWEKFMELVDSILSEAGVNIGDDYADLGEYL